MSGQDGGFQEEEYRYLWDGLDIAGADWDFDALDEGGPDWNVWDEPAPAPPPPPPPPPAPAADHILLNYDPRHTRHISASSPSSASASTDTTAFATPPRPPRTARHPGQAGHSGDGTLMGNALSTPPAARHINAPHNLQTSQTAQHTQSTWHDQTPRAAAAFEPLHRIQPPTLPRANPLPDPFNLPAQDPLSPSSSSSSDDTSDSFDGIDIDDLLNTDLEDSEAEMPLSTRRRQQQARGTGGVVDLTSDSPPTSSQLAHANPLQPRSLKRHAELQQGRSSKRARASAASTPASHPIEELDLTNENPSAEEELLQNQQQAAILAQQAANKEGGPLRLGQRQCIICMEPFTDVTITHCGHIYCHECLTQALNVGEKNGERGVGNCPVCRKPVKRGKANQMIAVSFMKKGTFKGKARRDMIVGA